MPLEEELRIKIRTSTELIPKLEDQKLRYQFLLSLASGRSLENYSLKISQINRQITVKQEALPLAIQQLEDLLP